MTFELVMGEQIFSKSCLLNHCAIIYVPSANCVKFNDVKFNIENATYSMTLHAQNFHVRDGS